MPGLATIVFRLHDDTADDTAAAAVARRVSMTRVCLAAQIRPRPPGRGRPGCRGCRLTYLKTKTLKGTHFQLVESQALSTQGQLDEGVNLHRLLPGRRRIAGRLMMSLCVALPVAAGRPSGVRRVARARRQGYIGISNTSIWSRGHIYVLAIFMC